MLTGLTPSSDGPRGTSPPSLWPLSLPLLRSSSLLYVLPLSLFFSISDYEIKQVKYASKYNIPFLASGGGHGYSTSFGGLQNGLKIDLSLFNSVSIDKSASTMTIGGSVKFSQVMGPLFEAGKEIRKYLVHDMGCGFFSLTLY